MAEIQIDLSKITLRELLRITSGVIDPLALESQLDRLVVGGIDSLTGADFNDVMQALKVRLEAMANPK